AIGNGDGAAVGLGFGAQAAAEERPDHRAGDIGGGVGGGVQAVGFGLVQPLGQGLWCSGVGAPGAPACGSDWGTPAPPGEAFSAGVSCEIPPAAGAVCSPLVPSRAGLTCVWPPAAGVASGCAPAPAFGSDWGAPPPPGEAFSAGVSCEVPPAAGAACSPLVP